VYKRLRRGPCCSVKVLVLRWVVVAGLLALAPNAASAQTVRLDGYRHPSEPKFEVFNKLYLKGVVDGLIAYTEAQKASDRFFCMPPHLAITVEQAEDIMLKYADKKHLPGTTPIGVPLLDGFREAFPCTKE
jgi:hypothetical protein